MTPQQLKAMKLALEALEDALNKPMWNRPKMTEAITAINEALADHAMQEVQRLGQEIEQEPVAWMLDGEFYKTQQFHLQGGHYANQIPLYTSPPQRTWVGLTEDERDHLTGLHLYAVRGQVEAWIEGVDDFAQAYEAKLKEKNT